MRGTANFLTFFTFVPLLLAPTASAGNSKVTPCASGSGEDAPCDLCDDKKAIEVVSWKDAKIMNFTFADAPAPEGFGGGYDPFWSVEEPAPGCRILLFSPFNTDMGSTRAGTPGNIILSVNHKGCYKAHIGTRGMAAGACCGDECQQIGAIPGSQGHPKRELQSPPSRIKRFSLLPRQVPGQNPNPYNQRPADAPEANPWDCTAEKVGEEYSKTGVQVIGSESIPCRGDTCDFSKTVEVSEAKSISTEHTVTFTNSKGVSVSVNAGFMMLNGPMGSVTIEGHQDFSKAVADSTGYSSTDTKSIGAAVRSIVSGGAVVNPSFAPHDRCQMYKFTCKGSQEKADLETCIPWIDDTGNLAGEQSFITTGSA